MTPDLLAALRETPGCGAMERGTDTGDVQHYFAAIGIGYGCGPCLTRLAEAVLTEAVGRLRPSQCVNLGMKLFSDREETNAYKVALLAALRSETPR